MPEQSQFFRANSRKYQTKKRIEWRNAGLCQECGKASPIASEDGRELTVCAICREHRRARTAKHTELSRSIARASGNCVLCLKRAAAPAAVCGHCRARIEAYQQRTKARDHEKKMEYQRRWRSEKRAKGC